MTSHLDRRATLAILAGAAATPLAAQEVPWPQRRPIQILVGFAPGGALDAITRAVGERLARALGQSVVVENRTGASGALAAQAVANAAPDGYTLIAMPGPILHARPVPRIGAELAPITLLARGPMVVAGAASGETPNLAAVLARAKADPARWSFGTAGVGSSHHIAGELLNERAGTRIEHVPYRGGGGQIITDLLGGRLPLVVIGAGPLLPHVRAGTVRAYAVTTAQRFAGLPDAPTLAEQGFPDIDLSQWFGVAAPANTPAPIVARLNTEISAILADGSVADLLLRQGMRAAATSPDEFARFVAREDALYTDLQRRFGIVLE